MIMKISLLRSRWAQATLCLPAASTEIADVYGALDKVVLDSIICLEAICPAPILVSYLIGICLDDPDEMNRLNRLAVQMEAMSQWELKHFSGAIGPLGAMGLNGILHLSKDLSGFDLIEGATGHEELGKYLVALGLPGVESPETILPYFNYVGLGADFYQRHSGDYIPYGYVFEKQEPQATNWAPNGGISNL